MKKITFHVVFEIKENDAEEFRKVADRFKEAASKEEGTLEYNYYVNTSGDRFIFLEVYADSEAVIKHQNDTVAILADANKLVKSITLQVLGSPSDELRKMLGTNPLPEYYTCVNGI